MVKIATSARAPRGTKILTKAFFSAAESLPIAQRTTVINAALAAIRDELKASRWKAAANKPFKPKGRVQGLAKAGTAKKIGRPLGSKNKPKVGEAPVVSEEATSKATKKVVTKAKAPKRPVAEKLAA